MTYGSLFPNGPSIFLRSCPLSRFRVQYSKFRVQDAGFSFFSHYSRKSDDDGVPLPRVVSHLLADDSDRPVVFAVAALLCYQLHRLRTAPHKVCKYWNIFRCPIRYLRFPRIAKSPLRLCSRAHVGGRSIHVSVCKNQPSRFNAVEGFGFRVSGFVFSVFFRVSGFGFRALGFGLLTCHGRLCHPQEVPLIHVGHIASRHLPRIVNIDHDKPQKLLHLKGVILRAGSRSRVVKTVYYY